MSKPQAVTFLTQLRRMNRAVWALVALICIFTPFGSLMADGNNFSLYLQTILTAAATIAAAFGGAWAAYELQWRRLDKEKTTEQVRILNSVQIELLKQLRIIELIQRNYIDPVRGNSRKAVLMRNSMAFELDRVTLNTSALTFLLDRQQGEIILRLASVEENFRAAVATFNERSRIHREEILPLIEKIESFDFFTYSKSSFIDAVGYRLYGTIRSMTDQCISHVDNAAGDLLETSKLLKNISTKLYPGHPFLGIDSN